MTHVVSENDRYAPACEFETWSVGDTVIPDHRANRAALAKSWARVKAVLSARGLRLVATEDNSYVVEGKP